MSQRVDKYYHNRIKKFQPLYLYATHRGKLNPCLFNIKDLKNSREESMSNPKDRHLKKNN